MKKNKIMRISIISIVFFLLSQSAITAQQIDAKETVDCIFKSSQIFLTSIKQFVKEGEEKKKEFVVIVELKDKVVLGYTSNGIYSLSNGGSHQERYLILKKDKEFKVITFKDMTHSLKTIVSFFKEINATDKEVTIYLESISRILTANRKAIYNPNVPLDSEWKNCG